MALVDDKKPIQVKRNTYVELLKGRGIITVLSDDAELEIRFDNKVPDNEDVGRTLTANNNGDDSLINDDEKSTIYGRAIDTSVEVLITREV